MTSQIGLNVGVTGAASSAAQLGRVGDAAEKSGDRWRKLGNLAKAGGLAVAAGAGAAAAGLYNAGQAAGDLGETLSKTNAIFGDQGGAALAKWAKNAEVSLGQSQQTALDAAATFGTFGKAAGLAGGDLVTFAQNNAQLATDMASFSNTSPEEAIEAIGAAFRGEAEPMRSYGVLLDDATLRTTALRLGLVKTTKEALTPQQKVLAAQAAILKQTKDAQGDFAKTSGGLAGQQKILAAQLENVKVKIGQGVLPVMTAATSYISSEAVPKAQALWRAYERNGIDGLVKKVERLTDTQGKLSPVIDEVVLAGESLWRIVQDLTPAFADAASELPAFLSPLQLTGDVLKMVADALEVVPDGVKTLGIEVGLAALILPRLTGAVTVMSGAFSRGAVAASGYYLAITRGAQSSQAAAVAMTRMGGAARSAAGIAGMVALTKGANETNQATGLLMNTLGGAALGASVGGPFGAVIGAAGGVAMSLGQARETADDLAKSMKDRAMAVAQQYADTLDDLSLKASKSTRELARAELVNSGAAKEAAILGLNMRDVVRASVGNEGAMKRLERQTHFLAVATARANHGIEPLPEHLYSAANAYEALFGAEDGQLSYMAQRFEQLVGSERLARNETERLSKIFKGFPKRLLTRMDLKGVPTDQQLGRVAKLSREFKLTPKQVRVFIKETGVDATVKQVERLGDRIEKTSKAKADFKDARRSFASFYHDADGIVSRGGVQISRGIREGTSKAEPDTRGVKRGINRGINEGASIASSGSRGIGTDMKTGFAGGFYGADGMWSGQVRSAVAAAIRAGKQEADSHSPSRKMMKLGGDLAKGGEIGLRRGSVGLTHAGADLIRDLVKGIGKEKIKAERVLDAIGNEVEKTTNRVKRLQELRASYVSDFQGFASSVFTAQAPTLEDGSTGPQTIDGLLSFAASQADQAKQVQAAVRRLTGPGGLGLSPDLIKQLRAQGAGGIEQILALSQGSQQQIDLLNSLNQKTNGAYAATGLGLFTTQGDKRGRFGDQLAQAQRDARLAKTVAQAIREALQGIKIESGEIRLQGSTIIAAINAEKRHQGKK